MTNVVYNVVCNNPGIDAPAVCSEFILDEVPDGLSSAPLALWLMIHHSGIWDQVCTAVDELIEEGMISFSSADGSLRATSAG